MKILELHYSTAAAGAEKTGHPGTEYDGYCRRAGNGD